MDALRRLRGEYNVQTDWVIEAGGDTSKGDL